MTNDKLYMREYMRQYRANKPKPITRKRKECIKCGRDFYLEGKGSGMAKYCLECKAELIK